MSLSQTELRSSGDRVEALLADMHVTSLVKRLPSNVFPVAAGLTMRRETANDNVFLDYKPPHYPVPIRQPEGAYIPDTTVYFDNPAEVADSSRKTWVYHEFVDAFREQMNEIQELGATPEDRIYITHLRVVEIPPAYVTSDGGHPAASPRLFQNEGKMTIGYFTKFSELSANEIQEKLGDALPDEVQKPLRLNRIDEVTAKAYDGGGKRSKRRYYTDGQAETSNSLEKVPKIWAAQPSAYGRDTRPLSVAVQDLNKFFPALSEAEFLVRVKLYGRERSSSIFVADDATVLET